MLLRIVSLSSVSSIISSSSSSLLLLLLLSSSSSFIMPPKKLSAAGKTIQSTKRHRGAISAKIEKDVTAAAAAAAAAAAESNNTRYWLMKSEPESRLQRAPNGKMIDMKFGWDDLNAEPFSTACWDGVRNYQARNIMRDKMQVGDYAFFYHSNCKEPGIVGIVRIARAGYPDHTQFDANDVHYDVKSQAMNPRWFMVDVEAIRPLERFISLSELKTYAGTKLPHMALIHQGRLSVQPVSNDEWKFICELAKNDKV